MHGVHFPPSERSVDVFSDDQEAEVIEYIMPQFLNSTISPIEPFSIK